MKKEFNNDQKEFIISLFENNKYPGWKNIATSLVEKGRCIVPTDSAEKLWVGGIGNFIDIVDDFDTDLVGCSLMVFSLPYLLASDYFEELKHNKLDVEHLKQEELKNQLAEQKDKIKSLLEL